MKIQPVEIRDIKYVTLASHIACINEIADMIFRLIMSPPCADGDVTDLLVDAFLLWADIKRWVEKHED